MYRRRFVLPIAVVVLILGYSTVELKIIPRADWNAQNPKAELLNLELPVERIVIIHTAGVGCDDTDDCKQQVKSVQNYQMKFSNFDDIGYNFLIGNDGNAYEGRGWEQQAAFARGYNGGSLGVAFIGNYNNTRPGDEALNAAKALIAEGVGLNKVAKDYKLYGHRQLVATNSPGNVLFGIIKEWPQWSRK